MDGVTGAFKCPLGDGSEDGTCWEGLGEGSGAMEDREGGEGHKEGAMIGVKLIKRDGEDDITSFPVGFGDQDIIYHGGAFGTVLWEMG